MVAQPFPPPVTIADRRDRGRQASRQTPPAVARGLDPGRRSPRSRRAAGRPERHPGERSGAGPARPDDDVAAGLLPGGGGRHGRRPRPHPDGGPPGAALRRRPPVQLRWLRVPGASPGVRGERLRRDAARPVRVRPVAPRGELHHRRPQQRVPPAGRPGRDRRGGAGLPHRHDRLRRPAHARRLVRPDRRVRHPCGHALAASAARRPGRGLRTREEGAPGQAGGTAQDPRGAPRQGDQGDPQAAPQGSHARPPARPGAVHRGRRRAGRASPATPRWSRPLRELDGAWGLSGDRSARWSRTSSRRTRAA